MASAPSSPASATDVDAALDLLFRRRSAQLTATLARILGLHELDLVEDVVQDAFVQAMRRWPRSGIPADPGAWILRVAKNRAIDVLRRQGRWLDKREALERAILPESGESCPVFFAGNIEDDELRMIFAACHPAIPLDSQVAMTLRTVGGFGVGEIARAFLLPRSTIAQRLVRAKRALHEKQISLAFPDASTLPERLDAVLEVLYLMFNEGHSTTAGEDLVRAELCAEAIRLAELLANHPTLGQPRVDALCALFLFQAARLPARSKAGDLVSLEDQDRSEWDRNLMRRALTYQSRSGRGDAISSYHLQAEIAGCHTLASSFDQTDWRRVLDCYDLLRAIDPSPVIAINRIVAVAAVEGPEAGLRDLEALKQSRSLESYYEAFAIESHLLARLGRAREGYEAVSEAAALTQSLPVRRHLHRLARDHLRRLQ